MAWAASAHHWLLTLLVAAISSSSSWPARVPLGPPTREPEPVALRIQGLGLVLARAHGRRVIEDLVWSYRDPQHDAQHVADHFCFFNERVDLDVDGVRGERPQTQWSRYENGEGRGGQALRGLMEA